MRWDENNKRAGGDILASIWRSEGDGGEEHQLGDQDTFLQKKR